MNSYDGGVILGLHRTQIAKHESVLRALETGDPEFVQFARNRLMTARGHKSSDGYVVVDEDLVKNVVPTTGLNHILNVVLDSGTVKKGTWYYALFTSNSTPTTSWDGDWGAVSGGDATEMTAAQMDGLSARPAATFGSAAAAGVMSTSAGTTITLASGVSDITVYGCTLNSSNTIAYSSGSSILLSAYRYPSAKSGLDATDQITLNAEFTLANA